MTSTSTQPERPARPRRLAVEGGTAPAPTRSSRPPERPVDPDAAQHARESSVSVPDGTISVRRTVFGAEHEEPAEAVRVPIFSTVPARVRVEGGMTIAMGNMEFSRISVAVEMPCYPEQSEVERTIDFCETIVGDRLAAQREMIDGMLVSEEQPLHEGEA